MNGRRARLTRRAAFGDQSVTRRLRKQFARDRSAVAIAKPSGPRICGIRKSRVR